MDINYQPLFEAQLNNAESQGQEVLENQLKVITRCVKHRGMLLDLGKVLCHRIHEAEDKGDWEKVALYGTYVIVVGNVLEKLETTA